MNNRFWRERFLFFFGPSSPDLFCRSLSTFPYHFPCRNLILAPSTFFCSLPRPFDSSNLIFYSDQINPLCGYCKLRIFDDRVNAKNLLTGWFAYDLLSSIHGKVICILESWSRSAQKETKLYGFLVSWLDRNSHTNVNPLTAAQLLLIAVQLPFIFMSLYILAPIESFATLSFYDTFLKGWFYSLT